jgi:hypothetical protein
MYLEIREDDGTTAFFRVGKVLLSPDLQGRCLDKRKLNRILRLIDERPAIAKAIQEEDDHG